MKELATAGCITALAMYLLKRLAQPSNLPLPPGPKRLPIFGHLFSMPRSAEHIVYANISKELNSMRYAHKFLALILTALQATL